MCVCVCMPVCVCVCVLELYYSGRRCLSPMKRCVCMHDQPKRWGGTSTRCPPASYPPEVHNPRRYTVVYCHIILYVYSVRINCMRYVYGMRESTGKYTEVWQRLSSESLRSGVARILRKGCSFCACAALTLFCAAL